MDGYAVVEARLGEIRKEVDAREAQRQIWLAEKKVEDTKLYAE